MVRTCICEREVEASSKLDRCWLESVCALYYSAAIRWHESWQTLATLCMLERCYMVWVCLEGVCRPEGLRVHGQFSVQVVVLDWDLLMANNFRFASNPIHAVNTQYSQM